MAEKQGYSQIMAKEMLQIMGHAQALVDATSGEQDDRIKSARDALRERLGTAQSEYGECKGRFISKMKAADVLLHEKPYCGISGAFRWLVSGLAPLLKIA